MVDEKKTGAVRPDFVPVKDWSKLTPQDKVEVANMTEAEYKDMTGEGDGETTDLPDANKSAADEQTHIELPKEATDYAKAIAAKVDEEMRKEIRSAIFIKKDVSHKVLTLFEHIERLDLSASLPRWDSKKPEGSNEPDTEYDVYFVPRQSKKNKALDPKKMHRLHDIFDQMFPDIADKVNNFVRNEKELTTKLGEEEYMNQLLDAKADLRIGRDFFTDATEVAKAFDAINGLPGVRVRAYREQDGSVSRKALPFQLQEIKVTTGKAGKETEVVRQMAISVLDLQTYRADVAQKLLNDGKYNNMYDAVTNSKPPRKPRGAGKGDQRAQTAVQTAVRNINDWESASADEAALIESQGFKADWLKRVNDPDKEAGDAFLLSEYAKFKFYDRMFGMNDAELSKRAGKLADEKAEKDKVKAAA